jgi:hypothetical protein
MNNKRISPRLAWPWAAILMKIAAADQTVVAPMANRAKR